VEALRRNNAAVYGAVGSVERNVIPRLSDGEFILNLEQNWLFDAFSVPVAGDAINDKCARYVFAPMNTYAASLALGYQWGNFGIFYAAGLTSTYAFSQKGLDRQLGNSFAPVALFA